MTTLSAQLKDDNSQDAQRLYDLIIQTSNRLLQNSQLFSIDILREDGPSYVVVAARMKQVAAIIDVMAHDFDPSLYPKAVEHCDLMTKIGHAIDKGDNEQLRRLADRGNQAACKQLFDEATSILQRVNELLLSARAKHERLAEMLKTKPSP